MYQEIVYRLHSNFDEFLNVRNFEPYQEIGKLSDLVGVWQVAIDGRCLFLRFNTMWNPDLDDALDCPLFIYSLTKSEG